MVSLGGRSREVVVCGTAVLAACLLVHAQALCAFFLADDYTVIGSFWGKDLRYMVGLFHSDEIGGVWNEQFVRPIRPWSLALDGRFWGLEPFGFHLTNLLLHASASILVGILILQLGGGLVSAVVASILFASHPLNVEVATWISGRDESLCAVALLGAVACLLESERSRRRFLLLGGSSALFALSLFSKEYGLLFPFAVWAWGLVRHRPCLSALRASLPYFGLTAVFLGVRWMAIGHPLAGYGSSGEGHLTMRPELLLDWIKSFLRDLWAPAIARPLAGAIAILGALLLAAKGGRIAAGELWLVGYWIVFWPLLFLMPTQNLVYTPRHLYISFAGVALAFGLVLARGRGPWKDGLALAVGASLVAMLVPPTVFHEEEFTRMSNRCRIVLASIEPIVSQIPDGDVLVLVNMPAHETPPWGFGWSLEDALRPPFIRETLQPRLQVIHRKQWRREAWAGYRRQHPNRGIHVLTWNPDRNGIEILRDQLPLPDRGSIE